MRLDDFFADETRRSSRELGLGSGWTSSGDEGAGYTVYWIEQTEELYAVRHPAVGFGPGTVKPYGAYIPRAEKPDEDREARLLGRAGRKTYDELLAEVEASPDHPRSLEALEERLRS